MYFELGVCPVFKVQFTQGGGIIFRRLALLDEI